MDHKPCSLCQLGCGFEQDVTAEAQPNKDRFLQVFGLDKLDENIRKSTQRIDFGWF